MADVAKWYAVHTYSGYENKVAATIEKAVENRKLQALIHGVMVPTIVEDEIAADGTKKQVEHKLFPGYVLVKMVMTDESWYIVRNTRGVTGFVGPDPTKPDPLSDEEVLAFGMEKPEINLDYSVDDSVRIVDGPLSGFIGTVDMIDAPKNQVRVIVSMFGRETPVELELDQVEPLE
ncbi:MAG: transcription termination/antitermination factor NusG [Clostridia bacterium]|nr:transcription termination/antitermination factor NusG [Oscillospiraceae bacterium]MBQ2749311.1 transcription termination/antitermination factor NusG [Clostridia bacterium]MBQ4624585.1 transcription termination/antitermination factor NusG [Clostridia bacterium]MBR6762738.1 transcription termination/antitermination factor NusG [Clostridia bacterium]